MKKEHSDALLYLRLEAREVFLSEDDFSEVRDWLIRLMNDVVVVQMVPSEIVVMALYEVLGTLQKAGKVLPVPYETWTEIILVQESVIRKWQQERSAWRRTVRYLSFIAKNLMARRKTRF